MTETQYAHPFAGVEDLEALAEAFSETFELDATNHGDTATIPLSANWDVDAVLDLLEATSFDVLGFDSDEVTVVESEALEPEDGE